MLLVYVQFEFRARMSEATLYRTCHVGARAFSLYAQVELRRRQTEHARSFEHVVVLRVNRCLNTFFSTHLCLYSLHNNPKPIR